MTTIDNRNNYCTLINIFTVAPADHKQLFELLQEGTENVMSKLPGFVSANLHISDDKKTIANYAQWETIEDFQNMLKNTEAQKHMTLASNIAMGVKPITFNQIWSR